MYCSGSRRYNYRRSNLIKKGSLGSVVGSKIQGNSISIAPSSRIISLISVDRSIFYCFLSFGRKFITKLLASFVFVLAKMNSVNDAPSSSSSSRNSRGSIQCSRETLGNKCSTLTGVGLGLSRTRFLGMFFTILFSCIIVQLGAQPCPNECSSHGRCTNPGRQCYCFTGYMGADCSLMSCPYGNAWVDLATGTDQAHNPAECSNMGLCDRTTGGCVCREGFGGKACERMTCPGSTSECNGVGQCQSMLYYAHTKDPGYGAVYSYNSTWDAEKVWGCKCDSRYYGPDCSKKHCPRGDDPLTGNGANTPANPVQYNEIQRVSCKAGSGSFTLTYAGQTTSPIPYNAKAADLLSYIGSLKTIGLGNVKIVMYGTQACLEAGTAFTVEFLQNFGDIPLLLGDSSKLSFRDALSKPFVIISLIRLGSKENNYCSRRGICDPTTGYCTCMTNYQTSNGYAQAGIRGDCGAPLITISQCNGQIACSSHGVCTGSPTYVCNCATGWMGADCSERLCPTSVGWFELPQSTNVAHVGSVVECGNMGNCDRASGTCGCMPAFTGESCQYLSCPGTTVTCNGHGQCLDISTLATLATVNGDLAYYSYGAIPNNPLTWDAEKIYGCYCDSFYAGYDCSLRTCRTGDDPVTTAQMDEQQTITCQDADNKGTVILTFRQFSTPPLPTSLTAAGLQTALQALASVGLVSVEAKDPTQPDQMCLPNAQQEFVVTFLTAHGDVPPIQIGNIVGIDTLRIVELRAGTKENLECSGRGECDRAYGTCACYTGFGPSDGMGGMGLIDDCGFLEPFAYVVK